MSVEKAIRLPTAPRVWMLLLLEMGRVLFKLRISLFALLLTSALIAGLSPAFSWISKDFVGRIEAGQVDPWALLPEFMPIFLLVMSGLILAGFSESILNKVIETRLIIAMQCAYLERQQVTRVSQDVAHVLYGSDVAKKGFQVIYKESWQIITVTTSVILWQLSLGAEWVPMLILSIIPTVLFVWYFGHRIQHSSRQILDIQSCISEAAGTRAHLHLHGHQERFFNAMFRMHIFKWLAENASDLVLWASFALLVVLAILLGVGPSMQEITLAELTALVINLRLLSKPLGNIGRVYTRWQEAYPALLRSLLPEQVKETEG